MQTIWLSPAGFVTGDPTLRVSYPFVSHPSTIVSCTAPGDFKWVSMGLRLPPDAQIEEVVICYEVSNARSFIAQVRLAEMTTPDRATVIHDDPAHLRSTTPTSYTSAVAGVAPSGAVTLQLRLNFQDAGDEILLGAVGINISTTARGEVTVTAPPYNADPSGTSDSSAAITAAITACADAGGGIVYFPTGTYLSKTSQAIPVGIIVRGDGFLASIVKFTGATDGFVLSSMSVQAGANIVKDLTITTNNPSSHDGVYVNNRHSVRMIDCKITGWNQRAAYWYGSYRSEMQGCLLGDNGSQPSALTITGITVGGPTTITVSGSTATAIPTGNVQIAGITNAGLTGLNGTWEATVTGSHTFTVPVKTSTGTYTSGGTAQDLGYAQIELDTCTTFLSEHNHLSGAKATTPAAIRIDRSNVINFIAGSYESSGILVQIATKYETSTGCGQVSFIGTDFEGGVSGKWYVEAGQGWHGATVSEAALNLTFQRCSFAVAAGLNYTFRFWATDSTYVDGCAIGSGSVAAISFEGANNTRMRLGTNGIQTNSFPYAYMNGVEVNTAGWGQPWSFYGAQNRLYNAFAQGGMPAGKSSPSISTISGPVGWWATANTVQHPQTVNNIIGSDGGYPHFLFIVGADGGNTTLANNAGGTGQLYLKGGSNITLADHEVVCLVQDGNATYSWIQVGIV